MKKLLILTMFIMLAFNTANATQYSAKAKAVRIPVGTKMQIQLLQTVDTMACQEGDSFNAMLLNDQKVGKLVVLPAGSVIRGCVQKVKPSKRFSRGAVLYLDFDHVVTPIGRQIPISLGLSGIRNTTYDGGIYKTLGYGQALKDNWTTTCNITKVSTNFGMKAKNVLPGLQFVTAPCCALGGAIGGFGFIVGDSVADLFKKGEDVTLLKGSTYEVMLTEPIDVPVN